MPDYASLVNQQNKLDSKFKFEHARVRTCSESIAFFGGDQRELSLLNTRFQQMEVPYSAIWTAHLSKPQPKLI